METQEILDGLYVAVLDRVQNTFRSFAELGNQEIEVLRKIADSFDLEFENEANDLEDDIETIRIVFYPIVQHSIVKLIQALIKESESNLEFSNQRLDQIVDSVLDTDLYPSEIGLSVDDSMIIAGAVKAVFNETDIFNNRCYLEMDGIRYFIKKVDSTYYIQRDDL